MTRPAKTSWGELQPGHQGRTVNGSLPCRVDRLLGSGGQGEVYSVDVRGTDLALKWYFPQQATPEQKQRLAALISRGQPNTRFLWPLDLVEFDALSGFGYVMPLRESRFKGIPDLLKRRIDPSLRSLAKASVLLADGFRELHANGWCYRDISTGNVFFDPQTGDILICDNDNVAANGSQGGVLGTPRFMAPEVVRGETHPGTQTDLFSLAVLLFLMLLNGHPLEGAREARIHCFDQHAMKHLYGTKPLFIFDPKDPSNAPVPGYQDNAIAFWGLYPDFLKDVFVRSFTEGLRDPHRRVRETEWRVTLLRLADAIAYCPCGAENFWVEETVSSGGTWGRCWSCGSAIPVPYRLKLRDASGTRTVVLNHDTMLHPHHLAPMGPLGFEVIIADVSRNPADPRAWGLRNLTSRSWTATLPDASVRDVPPQRSLALIPGTRVRIDAVEAEIVL